LEDLGINVKIILEWIDFKEIRREGLEGIRMAQDKDQWRVLVNANEPSGFTKGGRLLD
jgi:hypothetical protein